MKVLIIDPHRPEFFWHPIAKALGEQKGMYVTLMRTVPLDIGKYDIVVNVYVNDVLRELAERLAATPIVAISMGTDALHGAGAQVNSRQVARVIGFNRHHCEMLKQQMPYTKVVQTQWPADDTRLTVQDRPEVKEGEKLRIVFPAMHTYMKGLDNLVQMLSSTDAKEMIELHVFGPVLDPYLSYWVQSFKDSHLAAMPFTFYGELPPPRLEHEIGLVSPHAYIQSSQGEAGATTVSEGLLKGLPVLVQEHSFIQGMYEGQPGVLQYWDATSLRDRLQEIKQGTVESQASIIEAADKYRLKHFVEYLASVLKEVAREPNV